MVNPPEIKRVKRSTFAAERARVENGRVTLNAAAREARGVERNGALRPQQRANGVIPFYMIATNFVPYLMAVCRYTDWYCW